MPGSSQQRSLTSFFSSRTPLREKLQCPGEERTARTPRDASPPSFGKDDIGSAGRKRSASEKVDQLAAAVPVQEAEIFKRARVSEGCQKEADAAARSPIKEGGWAQALACETSKAYFRRLQAFLDAEYARKKVYPPREKIFHAFEACPISKVKVVILGQDPYHQPGQAHGLAFSVVPGVTQPPSLRNMIKEAVNCCGIKPTRSGTLDSWCRQGVLLLNTVLSVEDSKPNSHKKQGWETFTDAVVRELNKGDRRLVFLLWGKPSQKKGAIIDSKKHRVLTCNHPSPLSATKGPEPFIGSACFRKANTSLAELGHEPVDWTVA